MPLRGVGPLSGGYGVPTFESRTQSIPPTTQNAGRHFSKYRETPHSGQGCGVRKKNHDSHFLSTELTQTRSHDIGLGLYKHRTCTEYTQISVIRNAANKKRDMNGPLQYGIFCMVFYSLLFIYISMVQNNTPPC